jgi:hypothetical protein
MKTFSKSLFAGALAALIAGTAQAAVSAEQARQLGANLTLVGAEAAANKDGTIPAYSGGLTTPPATYKKGDGLLPDPYADEKPLFSIDAKNMDQYADKLTEGSKALMKRFASYRIDVYPTHRSAAFPKYVTDNTVQCAATAKTSNNGVSMEGCLAGFPFPIPQSGSEAMWNHLVRFNGLAYQARYRNYNVNAGHATLSVEGDAAEEYPYWNPAKKPTDAYYMQKLSYTGPARRAGEAIMLIDPLNFADKGRRAWQYLPGQRRVKLAPDISFDTPNPGAAGAVTYDDVFIFNGSMERYNFKLVGKKEIYVPYNDYKMVYGTTHEELLKPDHLNPNDVRWELHRVWVVEAELAPGKRHIYSKRRFYLDEDSWAALASDEYDGHGQLYRAGFAYMTPRYDVPAPNVDVHGHYDLIAGIYTLTGYVAETGGVHYGNPLPEREWTADALAGSGLR